MLLFPEVPTEYLRTFFLSFFFFVGPFLFAQMWYLAWLIVPASTYVAWKALLPSSRHPAITRPPLGVSQ